MKRDFGRGDAVCTDSGRSPSKEELRERKARLKAQLKTKNSEMDALSMMYSNYDYNQQNITELIGSCYIAICKLEIELKDMK